MIMNIKNETALVTPATLLSDLPADKSLLNAVLRHRAAFNRILTGNDPRLAVIVGPCSIHDIDAALLYAEQFKKAAEQHAETLFLLMRVYLQKPRTTVGWKGFISDPTLDGQFDFNSGVRQARKLLIQLAEMNVPAATEFLDPAIPHYIGDLISWCAIGARTTESQIHRELASSLAMPVGFKNSTDGNIKIAIDAVDTARNSHHFLSMNQAGLPTILATEGNACCHVILRGSNEKPNYANSYVSDTAANLHKAGLNPRVMIDCSHGNSLKHANNQALAVKSVVDQLQRDSKAIFGVMLESNLHGGKQKLEDAKNLRFGVSITDECISWEDTLPLLDELSKAVIKQKTVEKMLC